MTDEALDLDHNIKDAINNATGKAREGITDEEYELGIKFLKKINSNL